MSGHGICCACPACERPRGLDPYDDDRAGKAITRAAECDPDD